MPASTSVSRRRFGYFAFALLGIGLVGRRVLRAQSKREFEVVARKYAYQVKGADRPEIRVAQNELVRITFSTEDIAHGFTVEDAGGSNYRIMRRAEPGRPVTFDFRADTAGTFRFFCSLTTDPKCREMQGSLVVESKR